MTFPRKIFLKIEGTYSYLFSPLYRSFRISKRVAKAGFDWQSPWGILEKLEEEIKELERELKREDKELAEEELGDILFTIVNLARFLEIDPHKALKGSIKKFLKRYRTVKRWRGKVILSPSELDMLWNRVKAHERESAPPF